MADPYWNAGGVPGAPAEKRPRPTYDFVAPGAGVGLEMGMQIGQGIPGYLVRNDGQTANNVVKDTKSLMASYERYLQNGQISSHAAGESSTMAAAGFGGTGMPVGAVAGPPLGGVAGPPLSEPVLMGGPGLIPPNVPANGRNVIFGNQPPVDLSVRPGLEARLPPDASNTLFVEGLPPDSTHREVAHYEDIFRPFLGYKEVRLVKKESRHPEGDPLILCFVDFANVNCAATALSALQGYRMDEQDQESPVLRIQFARFPGPRSGGGMGARGRR
ncbi:RNA-binding protein 1 [Nymphaea thermarum]|nr:RNA-binding protein 1 [Nymphaea thermarum]